MNKDISLILKNKSILPSINFFLYKKVYFMYEALFEYRPHIR